MKKLILPIEVYDEIVRRLTPVLIDKNPRDFHALSYDQQSQIIQTIAVEVYPVGWNNDKIADLIQEQWPQVSREKAAELAEQFNDDWTA